MDDPEQRSNVADNAAKALLQAYHDALQKGDVQSVEATAMSFFAYACEQTGKEPGLLSNCRTCGKRE